MSDEPKQPPLRLKPRLRPESDAAESSSAEEKPSQVSETPAESTAEAKPKLRLKPRLVAEPEAAPEKQSEPEQPKAAETPVEKPAEAPAEKPADEAPKPIRLKPRLAPDPEPKKEEAAPTSETPAPEPPSSSSEAPKEEPAEESKPKFRLKPRLSAEPEETPAKEETEDKKDEAPAPVPPPVAEKPVEPEAPEKPAAAKPPPKFKLKKKDPEPTPSPAADPEPADSAVPPKADGEPGAEEAEASSSAMPPPPLVHLKASDDLDEEDILLTDDEPEEAAPAKKGRKVLMGLVVLIVLGAGGYLGWQQFGPAASEPTAPEAAPASAVTPKPATTLPGKLVEKAQSALNARRQGEQDRVDAVLDGKEVPESQFKRIEQAPAPEPEVVPEKVTTQSQSIIAPGVTATTTTVMSAVEASPAFRAFVGQVRINGVFQGSPARALLNGHTYREGQLVDASLGIYFDHVIAAKKLIVFRDTTGAIVQRKY